MSKRSFAAAALPGRCCARCCATTAAAGPQVPCCWPARPGLSSIRLSATNRSANCCSIRRENANPGKHKGTDAFLTIDDGRLPSIDPSQHESMPEVEIDPQDEFHVGTPAPP